MGFCNSLPSFVLLSATLTVCCVGISYAHQCVGQAAEDINLRCFNLTTSSAREECSSNILSTEFIPCMGGFPYPSSNKELLILVPDSYQNSTLKAWADAYLNKTSTRVIYQQVGYANITSEILFELKSNATEVAHHGWILDPSGMAEISQLNGFVDLGLMVRNATDLDWTGIEPFFRESSSVFAGKVVTIPLDGDLLLLYYRRDVFAKYNLTVPRTWEEFLGLAKQMNGTDFNGDGVGDYGVCMDRLLFCKTSFWIAAITAPYIQYQGVSQGLWFDPATMQALANNTAMRRALQMYKELGDYSPPDSAYICAGSNPYFTAGRCLMTINWGDQFKVAAMNKSSKVRGTMAVAQLPGSTEVVERGTGRLVPCTKELCMYGETIQTKDGAKVLNRAPYSAFGGWAAGVSSIAPLEAQRAAFDFFAYLASPEVSTRAVLDPISTADPFRQQHLELSRWVAEGYEAKGTAEYLEATAASLISPNVVQDIRLAGALQLRRSVIAAVTQHLAGTLDTEAAVALIQSAWQQVAQGADPNSTAASYRGSIGWTPGFEGGGLGSGTRAPGPVVHRKGGASRTAVVALGVVGVVLGLMVVVLLLVVVRARSRHRTMFGRVAAPGVGPDTTLVVTELQTHNPLWELLPPVVMDSAIEVHHAVVRDLLLQHDGYESATEGDSFILAFHRAEDALKFATQLQTQLLAADWPSQLLEDSVCKPVYVNVPRDTKLVDIKVVATAPPTPPPSKSPPAPSWWRHLSFTRATKQQQQQHVAAVEPLIAAGSPSDQTQQGTFGEWLQSKFPAAHSPSPTSLLITRGIPVNVGLHSGISSPECVAISKFSKRTEFIGEPMATAKAMCDVARYGTVVLSPSTYRRLRMEEVGQEVAVVQCGTHTVQDVKVPIELYQAVPRALLPRLGRQYHIRSRKQLGLGALQAPVGGVTIAHLHTPGLAVLRAWDTSVVQVALTALHGLAASELNQSGGYLVDSSDDLFTAAFGSAPSAAIWVLEVMRQALTLDWPSALLNHPLGEAVAVDDITAVDVDKRQPRILLRGLRLKSGLDTGPLSASLNPITGRITYRGKAVQRAALIATSMAASGQVLCTEDTWQQVKREGGEKLEGHCRGGFRLQGTSQTVTLYQCSDASSTAQTPYLLGLPADPSASDLVPRTSVNVLVETPHEQQAGV